MLNLYLSILFIRGFNTEVVPPKFKRNHSLQIEILNFTQFPIQSYLIKSTISSDKLVIAEIIFRQHRSVSNIESVKIRLSPEFWVQGISSSKLSMVIMGKIDLTRFFIPVTYFKIEFACILSCKHSLGKMKSISATKTYMNTDKCQLRIRLVQPKILQSLLFLHFLVLLIRSTFSLNIIPKKLIILKVIDFLNSENQKSYTQYIKSHLKL